MHRPEPEDDDAAMIAWSLRRPEWFSAIVPDADPNCHADRVAAQVTAQAMQRLLATALAGLAARDRDVLLLIAWEGLTYDEVAGALAIPVGTVRSRLNRARQHVRAALTKEPVNHG